MKICMLGYGGIAKTHLRGYLNGYKKGYTDKLVGVCDIDPAQFTRAVKMNIDTGKGGLPEEVNTYTDLEEMLKKEQPDIVDICLPTYLHCEYACKIMEMGYHVQCEKPMGLSTAECEKMLSVSEKTGKKLMVGMCLHFEPAYMELKAMVSDGRYGAVKSAYFERLSQLPRWGFEGWFVDVARSGGVSLDMHIHDVDIIAWLFGAPKAVSAVTSGDSECPCRSISSRFYYEGKVVSAIGEWGLADCYPFNAGFRVAFEKATVCYSTFSGMTVYHEGGSKEDYLLESANHMSEESHYFAEVVGGRENTLMPPESAMFSVKLVEKLMQSAAADGEKVSV